MNTMLLIRPESITDLDALTDAEKARVDWPEPLKTCCGKCGSHCKRKQYVASLHRRDVPTTFFALDKHSFDA